MKKNYILLMTILIVIGSQSLLAQVVTKQLIVCSGGNFSNPDDYVTVAAYSPVTEVTTVFDTIFTQSVQCVVVENGFAYVAAQDSIVKYNIDTYQRTAAIRAEGVHKLATDGQSLVASFWYPAIGDFVKTFSTDNLAPLETFSEVTAESDGIMVKSNGIVVVAVPGGWGSTSGKMAWLNLTSGELLGESDLGTEGIGISFFVNYYTNSWLDAAFTKTQWGDSTFNVFGFDDVGNESYFYNINAVLEDFTGLNGQMMYGEFNGGIGQFDLATSVFDESLVIEPTALPLSGSVYDSINELFYLTTTDYASVGTGEIYDLDGNQTGNFDAGISAEALAIDYRSTDFVFEQSVSFKLSLFPNPSSSIVNLSSEYEIEAVQIIDLAGHQHIVLQGEKTKSIDFDVSLLPDGLYVVNCRSNHGVASTKLLKQ